MEMSDESRTTVPVTVSSSALISNCRPLPEDIATLDEGDTGCQYCGVSYLLLSKYDRIVNHVSKLEKELETLKTFAVDHPILLANHAILQDQHKETLESMKEMEHELETAKEEAGRAIRGHHELQLRYTRLTHDFEVMTERNKWMDDSLRGQLRSMAGTLLYARDELGTLRQGFNLLKVNFRNSTDEQFETLKLELESTMLNQLPALIESEANHRVNTIMARSGDVLSSLKDQVAGLKEDLEQADKRYEDLLQEMNSTTEHYEEYIRSNKNVSQEQYSLIQQENENLSKRILELELKLAELQTTKEDLENSLLKEREESTKSMSVLKCALQEKEAKLNALTSSFEEERKAIESGGNSAVANINKALAQKDLEILKHQTKITELKTAMAKALEERVQTIEAHQSRVKQLQDKYQQMLKDAETRAASTGKQAVDQETLDALHKKFESEKIELLTTQKANFQKQLIEIQRTLQSQVDAARLSRDQTASEFKRKLATLEEDFKIRSEKLKGENDQLKTRIVGLELKASTEQVAKVDPTSVAHIQELESELSRKNAEIGFLKETVKMECEERMELLATLDSLQRGVGGGKIVRPASSAATNHATNQAQTQSELEASLPPAPPQERAPSQYQKLMAMASIKKEQKLKTAAKKNQI